jgi:hypothetical protein
MGYQLSGCDTGGLPVYLIKPMLERYDIPYLVETGSAAGGSARLAATLFKKVFSIELVEDRIELENVPPNVSFLQGDSTELLPEIISELLKLKTAKGAEERQWVLFFLDAHYSGDTPNESDYPECPVLEEIKIVSEYGEDAIIVIDDARLFFGSPPHPHDPTEWPSICEIFHLLKEKFPYHHITIEDDYVLAIPVHLKQAIDEEWRNRFSIRYPNSKDKLKSQVKDVYKELINYIT